MAFCGAKHARSRLDICPGATRNMPNVEIRLRCLKQNLANTGFSSSISHKKCARFFQNNPNNPMARIDSFILIVRRFFPVDPLLVRFKPGAGDGLMNAM